ncbi:MAG: RDD family protein [Thiomargarita sp.]|nr:RDD family protein [Thiomargarita sp.]
MTEYAGFWRRLMAFVVDMLWILPIVGLLLYFNTAIDSFNTLTLLEPLILQDFIVYKMLPVLLIVALLILWFWVRYGATPGKFLFDCEIVDARTGKCIGLGQSLLRYVGYLISVLSLGLGFLWIMWDKRKQGWADKIAGTMVIIHDEATVSLEQLEKYYR